MRVRTFINCTRWSLYFSLVKTHEQTRTWLPTHYISTCCYFLQLWIRIIAYPKNTFTGFGDIKTKIKYVMEVFSSFYSKQLHGWWYFLHKRVTKKKGYKNSWKREKISKMVMDTLSVCETETGRGFPTLLFLRWDKDNLRTQNETKW